MVNRKISPGAAHAGHHFIGDQKNSMPPADLGNTLQIAGRRHDCAQSRSADWFNNESGNLAPCGLDRLLQFCGIIPPASAAAIRAIKRTAIAIGKSDVSELPHQGPHKSRAVVYFPRLTTHPRWTRGRSRLTNLIATGLTDLHLILTRELECSSHDFEPPK